MNTPGKTPLMNAQHDPADVEKAKEDPVEFYNKYIRLEGEPVLNKEQYEKFVKAVEKFNKVMKPVFIVDINAIPNGELDNKGLIAFYQSEKGIHVPVSPAIIDTPTDLISNPPYSNE